MRSIFCFLQQPSADSRISCCIKVIYMKLTSLLGHNSPEMRSAIERSGIHAVISGPLKVISCLGLIKSIQQILT